MTATLDMNLTGNTIKNSIVFTSIHFTLMIYF